MKKNAVQHKKEVDLSIAAVQLNTMIRYMFSEHYRILKISTYRRGEFHFDYYAFKQQSKKRAHCCCCWLLFFFFVSVLKKSWMGKNKEGKTSRHKECANKGGGMQRFPCTKKNNKAHSFKTFLDKISLHTCWLYWVLTMWSFKVSNFIVFNFIYWTTKNIL